ncbi:unnamed protein product [Cochlearia groenlandica]
MCSLYFKGLVNKESSLSGFGVAILGQKDELLFQMKGPIYNGLEITVLEAELIALNRGLTEAAGLGINHIFIYCDYYPLYKLIMARSVLEDNNTAMLLNEVQRIREQFKSSFPIFVDEKSIEYAYKLARETIVSEITIQVVDDPPPRQTEPITKKKTSCNICLEDDIDADKIFCIDNCRHKFCSECVKRHIEVRLLQGSLIRCPWYRCRSMLNLASFADILTPKVKEMWEQMIKDDSIPMVDRVYCPNPRCSTLMSKTEISRSAKFVERRNCVKCGEEFCMECKVPWHDNLSCNDYKKLHPYLTENDEKLKVLANQKMWRQCGKCQQMIELSKGCVRVVCRCGHNFCYQCGAVAGQCSHGHGLPPPPRQPGPPEPPLSTCGKIIISIFCLIGLMIFCYMCYVPISQIYK